MLYMNIIAKRQTITTNKQKLYHEKPYDIGYKAKPDYYVIFMPIHIISSCLSSLV